LNPGPASYCSGKACNVGIYCRATETGWWAT